MNNIAIICGGYSKEYEISVESAYMVSENIDKDRFYVFVIVITNDDWYYEDNSGIRYSVNKSDFSLTISGKKIMFHGVFNAIHGTPGEDGKFLGYLDMLGIPYTSSNMDISALTFNKYLCNNLISALGVNIANSMSFSSADNIDIDAIVSKLGLPLFVKPCRSGSSVGVSKVTHVHELSNAINEAFNYDNCILIEEMIIGREIDCGLYRSKNELIVLPLTEIITNNEFFDYEAKYTSGKADEVTPPVNLDVDKETEIKAVSALIYNKLGCKGIVRIDYILAENQLYFIEINTVPGLSKASIVPKQAKAMGISISELFNDLVDGLFN